MPYVQPNSTVWVFRGVPLDKGYNHTVEFTSSSAQHQYFVGTSGCLVKTFTPQTYQRVNRNRVRVACNANELLDINYMIFRNVRTEGKSKDFYCFVDTVEYVNENCTEIEYTIDVMQTYWFDFELGSCFVEREHTETDVIGDNLVPENLEIGESVINNVTDIKFPYMLGALITSKPLPTEIDAIPAIGSGSSGVTIKIKETWSPISEYAPAGIPNQLYYYCGFPCSQEDCKNFWVQNHGNYDMQDIYITNTTDWYSTLGQVLISIGNGLVHDFSIDDIVDCYMYPAQLNFVPNINTAKNEGYREGLAKTLYTTSYRPTSFILNNKEYVPINQKLFTYPYVSLLLSNNTGNTAEFRFEDFSYGTPAFGLIGNYTSSPTVSLYPREYKNVEEYYDGGLTLSKFPQPAYSGTQFSRWIEQNRNSLGFSMLTSVLMGGFNLSKSASKPKIQTEYGLSLASSVGNAVAKVADLNNAPPQVQSQVVSDSLNTAMNRTGYRFYSMSIKPEFAEIVDNYFTMFGYAINKVKVPNIKNDNAKLRPYWNYVKTKGCIIHPNRNSVFPTGLPSDAENKIAQIFDNGITFWNWENGFNVIGDYTLDNSPT